MLIVVATAEEYREAKKRYKGENIIKTGVGFGNVYRALSKVDRNTKILNFGYAGSNTIPIGTTCRVGISENYHPNVEFNEKRYRLKNGGYKCLTNNDFVLTTDIQEPVLFDMELYAIMSMGFKRVESIKIVSDNLNLNQYKKEIQND